MFFAVQRLNCFGSIRILHLDKTVSQWPPRVAIRFDPGTEDGAERFEQRFKFIVCGCIRQIADIHTFHNPDSFFSCLTDAFPYFFASRPDVFTFLLYIRIFSSLLNIFPEWSRFSGIMCISIENSNNLLQFSQDCNSEIKKK